jgi:hypothetical protein
MNKQTITSQRTGVSTFASPASPSTGQSLQKSLHLSHPEKIELKKFPFPSENKKYATAQPNARQISVAMQTQKPLTEKRFNYSVDRRPACNTGLAKCGRTVLKLGFGNSIWLLYLNRRTQPRMPALR